MDSTERRGFAAARGAPSGPKREDDDLPSVGFEREALSRTGPREVERRCGAPYRDELCLVVVCDHP